VIILKTLKWSNCFSYGKDNEIDLQSNNLTQILGHNGAGKSSIPLILEEVLFNKNSKGVKKSDIPNRLLDGSYSIELTFSKDSDNYKIELSRKKTLKISLFRNGEDISSHTATNTFKSIEEIIGADFKTLSQLVYQSTTSSLQFLTATDSTRKKFLVDLLNLHKYTEYFEIFKEKLRESSLTINSLETQINTIENWLQKNDLSHMKVLKPKKIEINTEKDEEVLGDLRLKFKNISDTNKKISRNNIYKQQLAAVDLNSTANIKVNRIESYDNLTDELGGLKAEETSIKNQLAKIAKLGDKCPTCKQQINKDFKRGLELKGEDRLGKISIRKLEIEEEIDTIKDSNKAYKLKLKAEHDFETLYNSIDRNLPEETIDPNNLKNEIKLLEDSIAEKKNELKDLIEENLKVERNNTKIAIIKEQTVEMQEQLAEYTEQLDSAKAIHSNLEILKKAFSTNGLLAYKIENLVKELEIIVNSYLTELSDGRFTLEFVVVKDKLNVQITDNGETVDILSLSSGELARVNTATLLAIRKLMNSISKTQINVLFLDEIINVLDTDGKERLVDVLLKEDKLNIFIVSHNWTHPLLSKLTVVQENAMSRIEDGR
jgi:DNA repair exonuclease SbcCD ATPase subunit